MNNISILWCLLSLVVGGLGVALLLQTQISNLRQRVRRLEARVVEEQRERTTYRTFRKSA